MDPKSSNILNEVTEAIQKVMSRDQKVAYKASEDFYSTDFELDGIGFKAYGIDNTKKINALCSLLNKGENKFESCYYDKEKNKVFLKVYTEVRPMFHFLHLFDYPNYITVDLKPGKDGKLRISKLNQELDMKRLIQNIPIFGYMTEKVAAPLIGHGLAISGTVLYDFPKFLYKEDLTLRQNIEEKGSMFSEMAKDVSDMTFDAVDTTQNKAKKLAQQGKQVALDTTEAAGDMIKNIGEKTKKEAESMK